MELTPEERQALEKFKARPDADQKKVVALFQELFASLKAEWEAQPENQGKSVTYTELWKDFAGKPGDAAAPDNERR